MDDILLSDSNGDTLGEKCFNEAKRFLPNWGLQIAPGKKYREETINYKSTGNSATKE